MNRRDFIKSSVCAMGVLATPGFAYSSIDVDTKNMFKQYWNRYYAL